MRKKKPPTLDHTHAVHQAVETLVHAISGLVGRIEDAVNGPRPKRRRTARPAKRRSRLASGAGRD